MAKRFFDYTQKERYDASIERGVMHDEMLKAFHEMIKDNYHNLSAPELSIIGACEDPVYDFSSCFCLQDVKDVVEFFRRFNG